MNAIIIVTYNRIELLKVCLQHVRMQTNPFDRIIVIDNCSTDGTKEYLDNESGIDLYRMNENVGGAGGFSFGIKKAYEAGCDWITVIDDDAILDPMFHAEILNQRQIHPEIKAFACRVTTEGKTMLQFARRVRADENAKELYVWNAPVSEYSKEIFFCDLATFCGLTISSDMINKIGYPDKGFFISHDDTEYSMRLRKVTDIAVATKAIIDHRTKPISHGGVNWKQYYSIRNQIFELKKHYGFRYAWKKTQGFISQRNRYVNENLYVKEIKKMMLSAMIDAWLGKKGRHKLYPSK